MTIRSALIFGISGQDGSYLAEFLLKKNYRVIGITRDDSELWRLSKVKDKIDVLTLDYRRDRVLEDILEKYSIKEVYNLASQSHVGQSWDKLVYTFDSGALLPARIIDAIHNLGGRIRYFQASSAAIFGKTGEIPQRESTPISPNNPYSLAKASAHQLASIFRERFGYFLCSGIFYNHESPRRTLDFASRKISSHVAKIKSGRVDKIKMGNINGIRDWGYAPDYVEGAWMMLQADDPVDYILSTGKGHSVLQFLEEAFNIVGLNWKDYVEIDDSLIRTDDYVYIGDPEKIKKELGWYAKTSFKELVRIMVEADLDREVRREV